MRADRIMRPLTRASELRIGEMLLNFIGSAPRLTKVPDVLDALHDIVLPNCRLNVMGVPVSIPPFTAQQ